jgi:hypothetical protein
MNKNFIVFKIILLFFLSNGIIFAQEKYDGSLKNTIMLNGNLFYSYGLCYERNITPKMSLGGELFFDMSFLTFDINYNASFIGRYYTLGRIFYAELGLGAGGLNTMWGSLERNIYGFHIKPGIGWKIDVGDPGAFVIQHSVHLPIVIGKRSIIWEEDTFGILYSFYFHFGIGYTF